MDSTSTQIKINYAAAFGFHSETAAIVYLILYIPLFAFLVFRCFTRPAYVHFVLASFCTIRISSFVLRAVLISNDSVGETLGALIADEILFGVGFFALLYSIYTLVLDIETSSGLETSQHHPIMRLTRNRHLFRIALLVPVVLLVMSSTAIRVDGTSPSSAKTEHAVATVIFLVITALQTARTVVLSRAKIGGQEKRDNEPFASRNAMLILSVASVLLLIREAFSMITVNNAIAQNREGLWYPFIATPEILVVGLLSLPGLIPRKGETGQRYPLKMAGSELEV